MRTLGHRLLKCHRFASTMTNQVRQATRRGALFVLLLLSFLGCSSTLTPDIHSADPGNRILAIKAAGEARDLTVVPMIVDRLEDEDEAVRFYAILALDKIMGQRFGYDYAQSAAERAPAVERWRQLVRTKGWQKTVKSPATQAAHKPEDKSPNR